MVLSDLAFPIVALQKECAEAFQDEESLAVCTSLSLKQGGYNGMLIVDGTGKAVRVKGARSLHGIGRFWGYNIFLGRRIRLRLLLEDELFEIPLNDLKKRVVKGLRLHGRAVHPDYWKELRRSIFAAPTAAEVIGMVLMDE